MVGRMRGSDSVSSVFLPSSMPIPMAHTSDSVAGKWGMRGWLCPRSRVSSWDGPPSEGSWFHAGKNSRVTYSKVKAGLFREIHIP